MQVSDNLETLAVYGFMILVTAIVATIYIGCVWMFWSAAMTIPKMSRMRWPWTIWLLLLPIFSELLSLLILLSLSRSYRRYFQDRKVQPHGHCGYWTAMAVGILYPFRLLQFIPTPTTSFRHSWPHLAWLAGYFPAIVSWTGLAASISYLALAFIIWDLRYKVRNLQMPVEDADSIKESVAWMEGHQ